MKLFEIDIVGISGDSLTDWHGQNYESTCACTCVSFWLDNTKM